MKSWLEDIQKIRRDMRGSCKVLGCLRLAIPGDPHCARHLKYRRENIHFARENIPKSCRERIFLAVKYARYLKKKSIDGDMSVDEVLDGLKKVIYPLLCEDPEHKVAYTEADAGSVMGFLDRSPFRELIRETRRHFWMYRREPMRGLLVRMPYEFQVGEVKEEDGYFKVLLMMKVTHKFDGFEGYLSSRGGFLPKEAIKPILDDAFDSGRVVLLSVQRTSLHRLYGRKAKFRAEKAKLDAERKERVKVWRYVPKGTKT